MFLKRIELSGFKSFADRTELEFVQGITAVVGPNGSGKSNISDGIRWVLGEQSARSLRGGKMEDVIFAGSDARKAVNFGEVSLTLDNGDQALPLDFSEVTVTRRVHRSGESEYFINKQSCRLKDITELFMDTGIGKEAYSIIGQGRIEEILSTRSEDRRGIFEEASGIVKYKSRKKDANKKLDETEQNLLRIHDLVSELEDQIEPLREQSEKAVRYKSLREQLKTKEISMYVHQIEQIHRSWTEASDKLSQLQQSQLELSTVVSRHDAHLETHRIEMRKLEAELEQLQEKLLHYSEEFEKCEGYGEVLKERSKNLAQNDRQLKETLESNESRLRDKRAETDGYRSQLNEVESQLARLTAHLREEESRLLGVAGGTSNAPEETLKGELLDLMNRMAGLRNEIRYADQQKEGLARRTDRLKEEQAKWREQKALCDKREAELAAQMQEAAAAIGAVRNRYMEESDNYKKLQGLLDETQLTARKWEQKLDSLVSRRDTMKELQNDFDGFILGVKEVLKASRKKDGSGLRGVHGAVAELIRVPERLETAVETALGASMQHIVMENEAVSREAIAFLKKRQLGRATFLPLDVIRGRSISESDKRAIEGAEGFVGIAADLIGYEPAYANIVGSLLGSVVIAQTLEQANKIAAKCQYRFRVVTLDGDVVNAGGSMTGGSVHKKSTSLLGRQRQIDQIDGEIKQTQEQLDKLLHSIRDLKQRLAAAAKQIETLREQGEQNRLQEQQIAAERKQAELDARRLSEQFEMFEHDRISCEQELEALNAAREAAESQLEALQAEEDRIQLAIQAAETARKESESAKEELQSQLTDLKVRQGKLDQEKFSLQAQLRRTEEELAAFEQELARNRQALTQLEADTATVRSESVKQLEDLNQYKIWKEQCSEQIDFKRAERAEWVRKLEREENETKEQRSALRSVEDQLRHTEIQVNRLDVELDNLLKKLAEEYELSYELAKSRYPVPEDILGTQNDVRDLKRSISALGDVNLGAIEEYERVHERYQFLSEQKDDLIEAKTALYQVIREMDEEMAKRFKETFDAIRREFVVVFVKLFGGGRADLVMVEPERILETGIDIVAQPPGKKLQNLQLLSGGERALTAMALLFAILRVKPVPFCVLDEVEAALDEANVTRFAQYLREFSEQTQFIVVTHRKGTMEEADVLYGVTMEEGGVSKLVSVKLEDEEAVIA
ncbi:Chromosome partition protein Smc [Paenibacillus sp. CECT 9249]|uniref:chromosome segregation protein SMC n=1 Tax=Paenibacillus sp. CECT 9249 TaxID=2845385 RepID=UPI001E5A4853|nr:chromosome segregation protein SMC [Paenibacillus sp. CECT 9249]CAH0122113.1 Chromosome partition protein Smc [Paenibacillus sp. CECT 9249]